MIFDLSDVHTFLKSKIVNHQSSIGFLFTLKTDTFQGKPVQHKWKKY